MSDSESPSEESFWDVWAEIKELTDMSNFLWLVNSGLINTFYYVLVLWTPYYLFELGFKTQVSFTGALFPFFVPLGVPVYSFSQKIFSLSDKSSNTIFLGLACLLQIGLLIVPGV